MACSAAFSLIWGYGSCFRQQERKSFSDFFIKALKSAGGLFNIHVKIPVGLAFDYSLSIAGDGTPKWSTWIEPSMSPETQLRSLTSGGGGDGDGTGTPVKWTPSSSAREIIVPTKDSLAQANVLDVLMSQAVPVLFVGDTGTGKTVTVQTHLRSLSPSAWKVLSMTFTAQTKVLSTEKVISSQLARRKRGVYGPPVGTTCAVHVDDVSVPTPETYGAQPPIELLRQWLDHGGWYNHDELAFRSIVGLSLVAAAPLPEGGREKMSARFTRHFNLIFCPTFSRSSLCQVFSAVVRLGVWQWGVEGRKGGREGQRERGKQTERQRERNRALGLA